MFLPKEFPTVEALRKQSLGANKPTAFIPDTVELTTSAFRPATYFVKSYWTTTDEEGNFALAYGSVVFSFERYDRKNHNFYTTLEFPDLMVLGKKSVNSSGLSFDVERHPFAIVSAKNAWTHSSLDDKQKEDAVNVLRGRLSQLPDTPSGEKWRVMDKYSLRH
jgi:hypothetical protein